MTTTTDNNEESSPTSLPLNKPNTTFFNSLITSSHFAGPIWKDTCYGHHYPRCRFLCLFMLGCICTFLSNSYSFMVDTVEDETKIGGLDNLRRYVHELKDLAGACISDTCDSIDHVMFECEVTATGRHDDDDDDSYFFKDWNPLYENIYSIHYSSKCHDLYNFGYDFFAKFMDEEDLISLLGKKEEHDNTIIDLISFSYYKEQLTIGMTTQHDKSTTGNENQNKKNKAMVEFKFLKDCAIEIDWWGKHLVWGPEQYKEDFDTIFYSPTIPSEGANYTLTLNDYIGPVCETEIHEHFSFIFDIVANQVDVGIFIVMLISTCVIEMISLLKMFGQCLFLTILLWWTTTTTPIKMVGGKRITFRRLYCSLALLTMTVNLHFSVCILFGIISLCWYHDSKAASEWAFMVFVSQTNTTWEPVLLSMVQRYIPLIDGLGIIQMVGTFILQMIPTCVLYSETMFDWRKFLWIYAFMWLQPICCLPSFLRIFSKKDEKEKMD